MARRKEMSMRLMICLLLLGLLGRCEKPLWSCPLAETAARGDYAWTAEAQELVEALVQVVDRSKRSLRGELIMDRRRAHAIIWKLWLVTGRPPEVDTSLTLDSTSQRHVDEYRRFIATHAELTEEEVNRLGLLNCRRAFGSALCLMTLNYVKKKTVHSASTNIHIHRIPAYKLVLLSPNAEQRRRLSATYTRWLTMHGNAESIAWDQSIQKFEEISGSALDIEDLASVVAEVLITGGCKRGVEAEEVFSVRGRSK